MRAKWKILDVFSAIEDATNKDSTVIEVYPINDRYCGDSYNLFLEPKELKFWKKHIGEEFEIEGDPDLTKLSCEELRNILRNLKEKVEFT